MQDDDGSVTVTTLLCNSVNVISVLIILGTSRPDQAMSTGRHEQVPGEKLRKKEGYMRERGIIPTSAAA